MTENFGKEVQPRIVQMNTALVPGPMANTINIMIFGLSDDGRLYQWEGKDHLWIPA